MVVDRWLVGDERAIYTPLISIVNAPFCPWRLLDQDAMFSKRPPPGTTLAENTGDASLGGLYAFGTMCFFRPYET